MQKASLLSALVLLGGALSFTMQGAAISGTFNMTGSVTVTPTTMTWNSDIAPFTHDKFTLSAGSGSFAGANGQNTVDDLNIGSEPVGSTFPPVTFISFDTMPSLPTLMINYIWPGTGSTATCGPPVAVGQTCTPPNPGGSPFTFTNNPPPSQIQSSATWVFSGVTSDGLSTWNGIFTSQFNVPFQTVLAAFAPGGPGFVTNSYSATVTVAPAPTVPEPAPMAMIGGGVLALIALGKRKYYRA